MHVVRVILVYATAVRVLGSKQSIRLTSSIVFEILSEPFLRWCLINGI